MFLNFEEKTNTYQEKIKFSFEIVRKANDFDCLLSHRFSYVFGSTECKGQIS